MAEDAARKPETGADENANSELAELRAATQRFARRLKAYGLLRTNEDGADAEVMEWMPPSLTASQCAKLEMLQFKRMEGGIHEGS
jgi:hypothetical protein